MMCTNPTIANRNIEQTIKLANGVAECESGGEAAVCGCLLTGWLNVSGMSTFDVVYKRYFV